MRKKFLNIFICIIMITMFLCSCSNNNVTEEETTPKKITLKMSYWNSEDTVSALLDYLAEELPHIEIEFQYIENEKYDEIIDTELAFGEAPDIICESPGSALRHAIGGYLEPVTILADKYSDAGINIYSYNDNVYALPGISWFEGIWYNKEIFQQYEISLPKTFDEYITICKTLKENGIVPLAAGLKSWEPILKNSMAFVTAEYLSTEAGSGFGEAYRNGEISLNGTWNPYLEKWSEMITENVYTIEMIETEHTEALEQFATGNAAMFCSGPWDYGAIMAKNPDLQLDMMPFYGTQESNGWLIGGPGCGFAVNAASENKEAAMEILEAISTYEGQVALWQNNQGGSSYLQNVMFDLPKAYTSVSDTLAAGNVYCPWNEWGVAASAHEIYGKEMQFFLGGTQDISVTLQHVDNEVATLRIK